MMKKRISIIALGALIAVVIMFGTVALAGSAPTRVRSVGGMRAYVYALADGLTGDRTVAAGDSVETYGMTTHNIGVTNAGGTVTITPWFGFRVYDGSTLSGVEWVSGTDVSCTAGSDDVWIYSDMIADLVRFAAASCSSCNYTITWKGSP